MTICLLNRFDLVHLTNEAFRTSYRVLPRPTCGGHLRLPRPAGKT